MLDVWVVFAGLGVGFVVGLTGMGGGALMTPILVLFFGIQPLAAVSSDLVASMIMKPVGSVVHMRRGTVHAGLVRWLVVGSVPAAFAGVLLLKLAGPDQAVQEFVKLALGVALVVVALALIAKQLVRRVEQPGTSELHVRPLPTLLIGLVGGVVVGLTSVGSGSLIILMLIALYPRLRLSELVGTDLVQAVPLVTAASIAHLIFGDFQPALTASILIGALPGVYLGARLSSRAPDHYIRPALIVVLLASGMKLLGMSNWTLGWVSSGLVLLAVASTLTAARRRAALRRETPAPIASEG